MRNKTLWKQIKAYPFFDAESGFNLREESALPEYRKFLYLCAIYKRPQIPSKPIERILKMHQEKGAKNYAALCRTVLEKAPQIGSLKTDAKAHRQTRENYRKEFGKLPPIRYWPVDKRGLIEMLGFAAIALGLGLAGLAWLLGPEIAISQTLQYFGYSGIGLGMVTIAIFTRAKHDGLTYD